MDKFIKSLCRFSWASSLFGVKQLANALSQGSPDQPIGSVTAAFGAITRATEEQLDDGFRLTFQVGNQLQKDIVDFMYNVLTLEALTPRSMLRMSVDAMRHAADTLSQFMPAGKGRLAWQEFKNKLQTFNLFEHVDSVLELPRQGGVHLPELVGKTEALDPYAAVWATEGLGHYFAETFWERGEVPRNLLNGEFASDLAANGFAPLHAGMGLAFGDRLLKSIRPLSSESEIRRVLLQFVTLCQDNSMQGYVGAAYESLGLVTRNLYPQLIPILDQQLSEIDETLLSCFWHGVGRALYFAPTTFLPSGSSTRRAMERTEQEPPHELGRRNALAGLVWAMTLVNIREPEILEAFLKQFGNQLFDNDVVINAVSSAIMIWRDSSRGDPYVDAFCQHQPDPSDAALVERWERMVRCPCTEALQRVYPVLKQHDCLGEVFHYQDLLTLVQKLENRVRQKLNRIASKKGRPGTTG